jgi:hypothetical protein
MALHSSKSAWKESQKKKKNYSFAQVNDIQVIGETFCASFTGSSGEQLTSKTL